MPSFLRGILRRFQEHTIKSRGLARRRRARATRLHVEQLEERLALSWTSVPTSIYTSGATKVYLNSSGDASGSAVISYGELDRYYFDAVKSGVYRFSVSTLFSNLDSIIGVFDSYGKRLGGNDDISGTVSDSKFAISLTGGRRYYFGVTSYSGSPNGSYTWNVDGPQNITDDAYEDNDTFSQAYYLGTPTSTRTISGLALNDYGDYYRFRLAAPGSKDSYVSINFSHSRGNLSLALLDSLGRTLRQSYGYTDTERISLSGLAAGDYHIRVYGNYGAKNPAYSLTINPGPVLSAPNRVLNLNFDGANLSRSDLVRYAGSDWYGSLGKIDADANGVTVQPFLRGRSDRSYVINRMMTLIQDDLKPFGITVRRVTGKAVEGVGATTIFLGKSTLSGGYTHLSPDVDYGNNNRTDIAFVGDEYWGSVEATALAMADVTLHEAGHSWGLYHVRSGYAPETMGIRYSLDPSRWDTNTTYTNYAFSEYYKDGGGRGAQNSYVTLAVTFGLKSGTLATGPSGPSANLAAPFTADAAGNLALDSMIQFACASEAFIEHEHDVHAGCCCAGCGKRAADDEYVTFEHDLTVEEGPVEVGVASADVGLIAELATESVPPDANNSAAVDQVWAEQAVAMPAPPIEKPSNPVAPVDSARERIVVETPTVQSAADLLAPPIVDTDSAFAELDWLILPARRLRHELARAHDIEGF